ncbi:type II secretion system secretin GspD [Brevundimonas sp. 2R-24]|uniref:Type II secretion system secretin GspD n=1 Tax=Peiella sedimenti TaxID=3061083 RepID=A0ABT8SJ18_9CAUL|nr:type II secretion system secretin GspD [Caulobacteraceae bacterium XZ-24]
MTRLAVALVLILSLLSAPPAAHAQNQVLNYQNADIRAVVQDISRVTGRTFIVDPRVSGAVTVVSAQPLSRNELLSVFVQTLRANGLVVTPAGSGAWRISPAEGAAQMPGSAQGFSTRVFRLSSVDAAAAAEILRPLVSPEGQVLPAPEGNALVVADYADNLARISSILNQLDEDRADLRTVSLVNTSAREMAETVTRVLGLASDAEGGSSLLTVTPVASSNTVVLRGAPGLIARAETLIQDLDGRAGASGDIRVIHLQHADAGQLAAVLQQLVGQQPGAVEAAARNAGQPAVTQTSNASQSPAAPGLALGGQPVSITRYPGANALIIAASPETQRVLAEVVRQLDTRRQQVLVEAIVVEVSDTAARQLGLQYMIGGGENGTVPFTATNYSNMAPNLLSLAAPLIADDDLDEDSALLNTLRQNALRSLQSATGVTLGVGGQNSNGVLFGAILNAVREDTASNILSTPSVMALDNQQARFLGGQEVPVSTGEVLGDSNSNPFRTIERRNVGVQLEVTPQINAGGGVTLALRVEVSSVAGPISEDYQELIFNKREVATTVLADDGDIIVLGGLLDQNERVSTQGIPGLSNIPGVGALFRSNGRSNQRTNLMVFLRPTIISDAGQAQAVTARPFELMTGAQRAADPQGQSSLERLVREALQAQPPRAP